MADSDLTVTNPTIGWTGRKRKEAYYTDLSDAEITVRAELDDMITRSGEDPTATVLCVRGGQIKLKSSTGAQQGWANLLFGLLARIDRDLKDTGIRRMWFWAQFLT